LEDGAANQLLAVLDQGEVNVERDGIRLREPARFSLIASYDPAEGNPRGHLLDRIGLLVPLSALFSEADREAVIRKNLLSSPLDHREELRFFQGLVQTAREHLPNVTITSEQIAQLSVTALQYGVEGHRVDLFTTLAACASAALNLRDAVTSEDLELAARFVILPRATQLPIPQSDVPPPPPEPAEPEPQAQDDPPEGDNAEMLPSADGFMPPEQLLEAIENELPETLEGLPFKHVRRGRAGSRGSTAGNRGRHIRSVPGDPRQARIDVISTLRTAAPWQALRQGSRAGRVSLQMSDIRVKQYRSKAGALFCFAVDASGSMALHRMRQAKGAVHALLQQAYVNRDRVALIAFRGDRADLLMPPTQSVELARRALDLLPTGGGTPIASALLLADDLAQQVKQRGIQQTVLILLTDGRANVSLKDGSDPKTELEQIGRYIAASHMETIVVDTQRSYLSRGEARQLAEWMGGEYAYLPNGSGEEIAELVRGS
ncbi:MAG: magnesium chelatase ATPase subunit D, partial [Chloroflexota bacterium]